MRTFSPNIFFLLLISSYLAACSSSQAPYAYDDLYYSPKNDPIKKVEKDPREDFNKSDQYTNQNYAYPNRYKDEEKSNNYPESIYQNRYTKAEEAENQKSAGNGETTININNNNANTNQSAEEDEYYDENYARSVNQIHSPVRSFNSYDPYQRDRIRYTQDPFFNTPALCGSSLYYDPFVPRTSLGLGYNSFNGLSLGLSYGFGFGYNSFRRPFYRSGFYNPYYNPYYGGFYDPFNPYNRFGYGGYSAGFYNGFNQGFYTGSYYGNNNFNGSSGHINHENTSNNRHINPPRGDRGSRTYDRDGERSRSINRKAGEDGTPKNASTSPERRRRATERTNVSRNEKSSEPSNIRRESPERYRSNRSRDTYTRPLPSRTESERPSRQRPQTPIVIDESSRPNTQQNRSNSNTYQNRINPRSTENYNRGNQPRVRQYESRPQRQTTRPQIQTQPQSRPNINRSRPTYNRSTPTYRPSRSSGGSRSTRPSRGGKR